LPAEADYGLNAVWGSGPTDVFAVGSDGNIVRFDGTTWTKMFSGTLVSLNAVWGSSSSDVWAVGDQGVIKHFDGTAWTAVNSPITDNLTGVWGASADAVYAVGYTSSREGTTAALIRFDGQSWSVVASGLPAGSVTSKTGNITGTSGSDVYFGAGTGPLYHYDGARAPSPVSDVPVMKQTLSRALDRMPFYAGPWGSAATGVHLLGAEMTILKLEDGRWHVSHGFIAGLDVWAASGDVAFRVGEYGSILRYDGRGWRMMPTPSSAKLTSVWGSSASNVYAVGSNVLLRFDGTRWHDITSELPIAVWPSGSSSLQDVRGRSANEVYLTAIVSTGSGGRQGILRFDGTAWSLDESFPDTLAAGGGLWVGAAEGLVVGADKSAVHFDDGVWQTKPLPTAQLGRPWGARPDYVLASAGVQYDGQAWTTWQYSTSTDPVGGVWGTSIDDIVIAAGGGGIYERVGTGGGWDLAERVSVGIHYPDLLAVHGVGDDRFVVGAMNVIAHGRR
jgi:hypothetical protein